jgi:hypothetical protein
LVCDQEAYEEADADTLEGTRDHKDEGLVDVDPDDVEFADSDSSHHTYLLGLSVKVRTHRRTQREEAQEHSDGDDEGEDDLQDELHFLQVLKVLHDIPDLVEMRIETLKFHPLSDRFLDARDVLAVPRLL